MLGELSVGEAVGFAVLRKPVRRRPGGGPVCEYAQRYRGGGNQEDRLSSFEARLENHQREQHRREATRSEPTEKDDAARFEPRADER